MQARIRVGQLQGVHLFPQFAGIDSIAPAVEDIAGQGVELLDFEQATPDSSPQLRFRQILQNELGLENAAEVGSHDRAIFRAEPHQPLESH